MNDHETLPRHEHLAPVETGQRADPALNGSRLPRQEDLVSVGTRVSWGAILAGSLLALGLYFLFASLGTAVGLSISDRTSPTTLKTGTILWAFLTTIAALFVGGLVTSLFTVRENKTEAVLCGVVMWSVLFTFLLVLGAAGVRAGFTAMAATANTPATAAWETGAREAGVTQEQIQDWRNKQGVTTPATVRAPQDQQAVTEAATRISWYVFAGTWISMLAAAAGALVGAGPTFRLVAVTLQRSAPGSVAYARTS
jgi:hypothetical protein